MSAGFKFPRYNQALANNRPTESKFDQIFFYGAVTISGKFVYPTPHPPQPVLPSLTLPCSFFTLQISASLPYANHHGHSSKATNLAPAKDLMKINSHLLFIQGQSSSAFQPVLYATQSLLAETQEKEANKISRSTTPNSTSQPNQPIGAAPTPGHNVQSG
jgi:hypothetical protein